VSELFTSVLDLLAGEPHRRAGLIDLVSSLAQRDDTYTGPPANEPMRPRTIGVGGWRRIVKDMGLTVDPARGNVWSVTVDGLTLVLTATPNGAREVDVEATIGCPLTPDLLVMRRAHALSTEAALATGDARFDEAVFVASPDATVLGACDAATRKALARFTEAGGYIARGALRVSDASFDAMSPQQVEGVLSMMMAIAARLEVTREQRLANLLALIRSDASPSVRERLRLTFDAHAEVRTAAGARPAGASTVADLKARVLDPFVDRASRVEALAALVTHAGAGPEAPIMRELAPELVASAAQAIARGLVAGSITPPVGLALVAYLDHNAATKDDARVAMLDALGRTRDARLASWLGQMLLAPRRELARAALGAPVRVSKSAAAMVAGLAPEAKDAAMKLAAEAVSADPSLGCDLLLSLRELVPSDATALLCEYLAAMAATGDERAADTVASELAHEDPTTRLTAIRALGAVGGPAHVGRLGELTRGMFRGSDEKASARAAVEAIHARIGTHLRGGVAVSEGSEGGVSVVDE